MFTFHFCQCYRLLGEFLLPPSNNLPRTCREVFLIMKEIGMDYQAIDACLNDHIMYYGQYVLEKECLQFHISRYRTDQLTKKVDCKVIQEQNHSIVYGLPCIENKWR